MTRLRQEHVYTRTGPQRPVFLCAECKEVRFAVEPNGVAKVRVEVTHDPPAATHQWFTYEGGDAGGVLYATALRLVIDDVDGWVTLHVEEELEKGN